MTDFRLTLTEQDGVLVARIDGEIDFTNVLEIEQRVLEASSNDMVALAVDLTDAGYLDSAGVRLLFDFARHVEACRQRLGLIVTEDAPLRRLITVTNLSSVASVHATEDECVTALRNGDVAGMR